MTSPTPALRVTFHGAARTVTGSMHHVRAGKLRLLLDCGLFQGRRAEARARNESFPFVPKEVDAVLLSHAHIDHSGNLPNLVKRGFRGPIYCTPATRDLLAVMLNDSAHIQQEDADYLNRKRLRGEPRVLPLYERADVLRTLRQVESVPYGRVLRLGRGGTAMFHDAGHLLGSAMIHLKAAGGSLTFTGDLGRRGTPILRDPEPVPPADLLLCESTYGGISHEPIDELRLRLLDVVRRAVERQGKVLIPAFSLGRTQTVLYHLHRLRVADQLPEVPVFVDSPLASEATEVFRLHPECFDEEALALIEEDPEMFGGSNVRFTRAPQESRALNDRPGPMIIIAASGMCEAGRILHHLKHGIEDPRNIVVIVGYQAPETLGRKLVEKRPEVRILDEARQVRAEVVTLNGFSSHAGQDDFDSYLGPLAGQVKKVCLVHGELPRAEALATSLKAAGFPEVLIPAPGDEVDVP
jgi:metallo-beta-lactamase family protein